MDTIGIISAGIGNVGSLSNMLNHLGFPSRIIENCKDINNCKKVILPGVGNFFHGMQLLQKGGWVDDIKNFALTEQRPILGICLGMQLMTRSSEEGDVDGLSLVDARTVRFSTIKKGDNHRLPHMGWNTVDSQKQNYLFNSETTEEKFYFVHSYHVICNNAEDVLTTTEYGYPFVSAFQHKNIVGVQFHPEKSHRFGMQLLKNFVEKV